MEVSWGFIIVLLLVFFPGLIIRRLYYYGEFSKEFSGGHSLIKLISISSIPGFFNLICIFYFYDSFITDIDLGKVIDTIKDVSNPVMKLQEKSGTPIKSLITSSVFPFLGFLYISSFFIGLLSGRIIRITGIDTKFKLLRFKNYWFYVFTGEHTRFKKMKHLKEQNKKHLFTKADILIDTSCETQLYSGVIVDYELEENNCQVLSKVMLINAERYSLKDNKRARVPIPGQLLIVDCLSMKNINLTYVYEKTNSFLEKRTPSIVASTFSIIVLLLIPFFIFKADYIDWDIYTSYFDYPWYKKIVSYLFTIQLLNVFNPFLKNKDEEYGYVGWTVFIVKIVLVGILFSILKFGL